MSEIAGLILVLLVPLCGLLPAQTVPPLINYQGQLSDAAGNPLPTADYTLTFTIHDAATGGSQVWGPQIFDGLGGQGHGPKIPVVQGFFNVLLGPVDTAGRSLADAFNAPNRWVEIKVGNNAPIAPRQQILSAPFAFRAAFAQEAANAQTAANAQNAQNLEGRPAGTFVAKAGDTMTGRLNLPNDGLTVGGNQLVVANGNVGIGTPAPKAKLDVAGTVKAHKLQLNGGDDWTDQNWTVRLESPLDSAWRSTTTDFDGKYLGLGMTHSGWYFLRSTAADTSAPAEYPMVVRNTGEVGIGTISPQAKLEVAGAVALGDTANPTPKPGTIRWTGSDFEGYNGTRWVSLTMPSVYPIPNMVWIGPGTFTMGSPTDEPWRDGDEGPQTVVTISRGFWLGRYEVTQREYLDLMGVNPSYFTGDLNRPVEKVSWQDATNYCARLAARERSAGRLPAGWEYRLPTEAQWEYACRAGTVTAFHYGGALRSGMANFNGRYEYPPCGGDTNYCYNASGQYLARTTTVGSYAPNPWGLYDMHGNVWEWCMDWYARSYPGGSVVDPTGPATGSDRVGRGGGWHAYAIYCRSADRYRATPDYRGNNLGFRVALVSVP